MTVIWCESKWLMQANHVALYRECLHFASCLFADSVQATVLLTWT